MLILPGFSFIRLDWESRPERGMAIIHKKAIPIKAFTTNHYPIFEYLGTKLTTKGTLPIKLHTIYHPPGDNQTFLDHFSALITDSALTDCHNIFLGDLNLHWNDPMSQSVKDLTTILNLHDLHQLCNGPTHNKGSTLDAIITKSYLVSLKTTTPLDWSDHYLILFNINTRLRDMLLLKKNNHIT